MAMLDVLRFWFLIQLFALAVWPLAARLFAALPSRGYALAKPLGLLLVTYGLWIGGSLGLLRNSAGGALAALAVVAAASLWATLTAPRNAPGHEPLRAWLRGHWRLVLLTEALFLLALAGWAAMRSYSPEITTAGGEKWMELTFLNGILRSPTLPPLDPWLSGFAISYYYFGYLMLATLTRLSGLAPSVAFNVGLATWAALTITTAFGIGYDMAAALLRGERSERTEAARAASTRALAAMGGLLAALFVGVLGNLAGFLESLHSRGIGSLAFWRWLDVKDLNCLGGPDFTEAVANCPAVAGWTPERYFWWWRASRVITDRDLAGRAVEVIDEFPFFSFLLGDMHPHVLALPFVLLAIGALLAFVLHATALPRGPRTQGFLARTAALFPLGWAGFVLAALSLGSLGFLNTWDLPVYGLLWLLTLIAVQAWRARRLSARLAGEALAVTLLLGVTAVALYAPFYVGFQSQAGGILPNFLFPTRLSQFFVMFGPLLAAVLLLLTALSLQRQPELAGAPRRSTLHAGLGFFLLAAVLPVLFLLAVLLVGVLTPGGQALIERLRELPVMQGAGFATFGELAAAVAKLRLTTPWTYLLLAGMIGWTLALLRRALHRWTAETDEDGAAASPAAQPVVVFALLLLLVATLLVFSVEFVYLRDTFGTRMNTVFKFYFQGWVLMALAAAFGVVYVARHAPRGLRAVSLPVLALLTAAGLFYPVFASYTRGQRFAVEPTLDGAAYLAVQNPADAAAVAWLRQNVRGPATVLEAAGGSYSYAGRISTQTGLATLLGWDGHELQWRGNTVEQDKRRPVIERIYGSATGSELQTLLNQWRIDYVLVGPLERQTYGVSPQSEARLAQIMQLVYDSADVRIYRNRQAGDFALTSP